MNLLKGCIHSIIKNFKGEGYGALVEKGIVKNLEKRYSIIFILLNQKFKNNLVCYYKGY